MMTTAFKITRNFLYLNFLDEINLKFCWKSDMLKYVCCAAFGHHKYGVNQLTFFLGILKDLLLIKIENWSTQLVFEIYISQNPDTFASYAIWSNYLLVLF